MMGKAVSGTGFGEQRQGKVLERGGVRWDGVDIL